MHGASMGCVCSCIGLGSAGAQGCMRHCAWQAHQGMHEMLHGTAIQVMRKDACMACLLAGAWGSAQETHAVADVICMHVPAWCLHSQSKPYPPAGATGCCAAAASMAKTRHML